MNAPAIKDPINEAILLLTEEADSLSDCHTRKPGEWAEEPVAKAHYDHILAVAEALSKLRAPVAVHWRPMDTAPLDGREVLLLVERRAGIPGRCLVGHYMPGGHCIEDHPPIAQGWYFWDGREFDRASKPTGWLPLPPDDVYAALASAPVAGEAQNPVAWLREVTPGKGIWRRSVSLDEPVTGPAAVDRKTPLYAAPQASEAVPVAWAIFSPSGNIRYWHHDKSNVEAFAAKHGLTVCGLANAGPKSSDAQQIADLVLGHAEGLRVSSLLESGIGFGKDVEHRFQVSNGEDRYGVVIILTALSAQPGAQKEQDDA